MTSIVKKPIYVLAGDDAYLRDENRRRIVDEFIGSADPQLCLSDFDSQADPQEVFDALWAAPFLAPVRVVVVRDGDAFISSSSSVLEKYLQSPCTSSVLVLMVSSWKQNTRIAKLLKQVGEVVSCSTGEKESLVPWIMERAGMRGKQITRSTAAKLEELVGKDRAKLDSELEKLSLHLAGRTKIEIQDVEAVVLDQAGPAAFAMSNALLAIDAKSALAELDKMLIARGSEMAVLGQIAWNHRRLLEARQRLDSGESIQQVVPRNLPYVAQQAMTAFLRARSLGDIEQDFRWILRADLAIKSGADVTATLQQLLVRLCRRSASAGPAKKPTGDRNLR